MHWFGFSKGNGQFHTIHQSGLNGWCKLASYAIVHYADVNGDGRADPNCRLTSGKDWTMIDDKFNGVFR